MGRHKIARTKTCPRCEREFTSTDWRNTYCSRTCAMTRDLPTKTCTQCGKEFRKNPEYSYAVWKAIKYCSVACRGAAWRRFRTCEYCGSVFTGKSAKAKQLFCSRQCYWLSLRTKRYPVRNRRRGQEFSHRVRRQLMERANGRCRLCGATRHLQYDHIIPCHTGGSGGVSNGQVLCERCHAVKTASEIAALFRR